MASASNSMFWACGPAESAATKARSSTAGTPPASAAPASGAEPATTRIPRRRGRHPEAGTGRTATAPTRAEVQGGTRIWSGSERPVASTGAKTETRYWHNSASAMPRTRSGGSGSALPPGHPDSGTLSAAPRPIGETSADDGWGATPRRALTQRSCVQTHVLIAGTPPRRSITSSRSLETGRTTGRTSRGHARAAITASERGPSFCFCSIKGGRIDGI